MTFQKLNFEDVQNYIQNEDYLLISENYEGSKIKLSMVCPNGHECSIRFNDFKDSNVRCKICRLDETRYQFDFVKRYIESEGYELLSTSYDGSKKNLTVRCPLGHEYGVTFNNFKVAGKRCRQCYFINKKFTYDYVKEKIEEKGFTLISKVYEGSNDNLLVICSQGHEVEMTYANIYLFDCGCLLCYRESQKGIGSHWWNGGITPENKRIRQTSEYKAWRTSVFERDNYTCQACNRHGGTFHAHHIENFSEHVDKRFDINNGITLCVECHSQTVRGSFHHIYGNSNNNIEQLNEFITYKQSQMGAVKGSFFCFITKVES